jgi:CDP-glucose 4,6-dehydratase
VLDPLGGYIELARRLFESDDPKFQGAFNFGPTEQSVRTVADLVRTGMEIMPGQWEEEASASSLHEATLLSLTIQKAGQILGWSPRWDFDKSVWMTMEWYKGYFEGIQAVELVSNQISEYIKS